MARAEDKVRLKFSSDFRGTDFVGRFQDGAGVKSALWKAEEATLSSTVAPKLPSNSAATSVAHGASSIWNGSRSARSANGSE